MRVAEARYCLDCRWIDVSVDFDGRSNYRCAKLKLQLDGPLAWKPACGLYRSARRA